MILFSTQLSPHIPPGRDIANDDFLFRLLLPPMKEHIADSSALTYRDDLAVSLK